MSTTRCTFFFLCCLFLFFFIQGFRLISVKSHLAITAALMCYMPKLVAVNRSESQTSCPSHLLNQEGHLSYATGFLSCLNYHSRTSGHPEVWVWFCSTCYIFTFNASCIYTRKKTLFREEHQSVKAKDSRCILICCVIMNIFSILIFSIA